MKRLTLFFALCFMVFTSYLAVGAPIHKAPDITKDQLAELKLKALSGNGRSALILFNTEQLSATERRYWATIAAEDGFPPAIYYLGHLLGEDESDPANAVRARFWLNAAKAHGISMANLDLCILDSKSDPKHEPCHIPADMMKEVQDSLHKPTNADIK